MSHVGEVFTKVKQAHVSKPKVCKEMLENIRSVDDIDIGEHEIRNNFYTGGKELCHM